MKNLIIIATATAMIVYCLMKAEDKQHKAIELQKQLDSIEAVKDSLHIDSTDLG